MYMHLSSQESYRIWQKGEQKGGGLHLVIRLLVCVCVCVKKTHEGGK